MMRMMLALALVTVVVGCDEKKDAPATVAAVASGGAVAPSGAVVAPSGAVVAPSGAAGASPKGAASKPGKVVPAPAPSGMMPHGSAEDGTLKYNPPAAQNGAPSGAATKK